MTSVDGINAVLGKSIGLGKGLTARCLVVKQQSRQPAVLPPDPQFIPVTANGIDLIIGWDPGCNGLNASILERIQPTLRWSEPDTTVPVSVNRSIALESRIDGR